MFYTIFLPDDIISLDDTSGQGKISEKGEQDSNIDQNGQKRTISEEEESGSGIDQNGQNITISEEEQRGSDIKQNGQKGTISEEELGSNVEQNRQSTEAVSQAEDIDKRSQGGLNTSGSD